MRRRSLTLAFAIVAVAWPVSSRPCAADDTEVEKLRKRVAELQEQNESQQLKIWWLQRMRGVDRFMPGAVVIRDNGSEPALRKDLRALRLPPSPTDDDVREYVLRIIVAAQGREMYSPRDPEIGLLKMVGPAHVKQLIEPLVYLEWFHGSNWVIDALKSIVREEDKPTVLWGLPFFEDLVDVVVARGWTKDAAPILLQGLAKRSTYQHWNWIAAAATVAGPQNYEDFKFQLAHGTNPWMTWLAIRNLPGIEPLDALIQAEWPRHRESSEFAALAAHYGHLDALGVLARHLDDKALWQEFQGLTEYSGPQGNAAAWLDQNRDRLVFDAAKHVYSNSAAKPK